MKVIFYHAGCPVCLDAERQILQLVDAAAHDVQIVHLGDEPGQVPAAKQAGVKSVPALVIAGNGPIHLNFGASMADLEA
nr:conjugal transfer protein TraF [Lewinella sp. 4G2]